MQACDAFEARLYAPIDKTHAAKWFELSLASICYGRAGQDPPSSEKNLLAGYKSLQLPSTIEYEAVSGLRQGLGTSSPNKRDQDRWERVRNTIEASTHRVNWQSLRRGKNRRENIWVSAIPGSLAPTPLT